MAPKRKRSNGSSSSSSSRSAKRVRTATKRPSAPLATRGFRFPVTGTEKKFFDIAAGNLNVSTTASINLLCVPQLGTDYTNRIGRKILIKSLYIRGYVSTEAANSGFANSLSVPTQLIRMIVLADMQPNGSAPAATDILNTSDPASQLNANNRDRFKIIKDKQWVLGATRVSNTANEVTAMTTSPQAFPLKWYKKLNLETIFNAGNAGAIADINSGALYLVFIGNRAAGTLGDSNAYISTRVRFVDN